MAFAITGASGQLGASVLRHLAGRISPSAIVAVTRTPGKVRPVVPRDTDVRAGDFDDPAGLQTAFAGVDRLLIVPGSDLGPGVRPRQHANAIAAAASAGVRHIIYISSVGARTGPRDGILETHFATEQALIASGVPWTILRMGPYAELILNGAGEAIAKRRYAAVAGAPAAYVARDDVAVAAAALLTSAGHEGITYHATGPVSITHAHIAEALSRIAGVPVEFSSLTIAQYEAGLAQAGLPASVIEALSRFQAASRDGAFDLVTGDVERLSGTPAQSLVDLLTTTLASQPA